MKKLLIILGIMAATGLLVLVVGVILVVSMIRKAEGPALYSSVGAWTRVDEFAHAQGKTNYIAFADNQLSVLQDAQKEWQKGAGNRDLSSLQKMQTNAYATTDRNIKSGINPLAFLDNTNFSAPPTLVKGKQ